MIYVVSKKNHQPTDRDVYIGRPSILGNNYSSKRSKFSDVMYVPSPEVAVELFAHRLHVMHHVKKDQRFREELNRIWRMALSGDVYLVCHCKITPNDKTPCHGDVIKQTVESKLTYE